MYVGSNICHISEMLLIQMTDRNTDLLDGREEIKKRKLGEYIKIGK